MATTRRTSDLKEVMEVTELKQEFPPRVPPQRKSGEIPAEIRSEIVRLHGSYGTRQIAARLGESRKIVRRVLQEEGCLQPQRADPHGRLTPFHESPSRCKS